MLSWADWYKWALQRLGLKYKHETFGTRNAVEGFFSILKGRTKRFFNRFPFYSSFDSVQSWLESFVGLSNVERWLFWQPRNRVLIKWIYTLHEIINLEIYLSRSPVVVSIMEKTEKPR